MSEKDLTSKEKSYLQRLFWDYQEKIDRKMKEEVIILSKYKGELSKNYALVGDSQCVLLKVMDDIIRNQEGLSEQYNQTMEMLCRIHNSFVKDTEDNK